METLIEKFEVTENLGFTLKNYDPDYSGDFSKDAAKEILNDLKSELKDLQEKFYVNRSFSMLIILQAMDAAGKDSAIEHVMGGLNPQGCRVDSFKQPTSEELRHDFLWRHSKTAPERGIIGIHNRSHYESVLVCKVHPELILEETIPGYDTEDKIDKKFWDGRYESIKDFEKHLHRNGTIILKFFLNVSQKEQKERFLERIDDPQKNWKFSAGDIEERKHWKEYMKAYEEAISKTSTSHAPWFVIPADKKWFARIAICSILLDKLKSLSLKVPKLSDEEAKSLEYCKALLQDEKD